MGSSKWHTNGKNSDSYIKIKKYKKSEKISLLFLFY